MRGTTGQVQKDAGVGLGLKFARCGKSQKVGQRQADSAQEADAERVATGGISFHRLHLCAG
jgi:hypothetical protein